MNSEIVRLIKDTGQAMTLSRKTRGAYNPATGESSISGAAETVRGIRLSNIKRTLDGSLIESGDARFAVSTEGLSSAPKTSDTITAAGTEFQIVDVQTVEVKGAAVAYFLTVRK